MLFPQELSPIALLFVESDDEDKPAPRLLNARFIRLSLCLSLLALSELLSASMGLFCAIEGGVALRLVLAKND
jgi:hypothetical protein